MSRQDTEYWFPVARDERNRQLYSRIGLLGGVVQPYVTKSAARRQSRDHGYKVVWFPDEAAAREALGVEREHA